MSSFLKFFRNFLLFGALAILANGEDHCEKNVNSVANTQLGKLRGNPIRLSEPFKDIVEFLGVPYAKPPINELRFADPLPIGQWSEVRSAQSFGPSCLMSEDCLHLNIWTPSSLCAAKSSKLPIMFFIHGGSFNFGSASGTINGTQLAAHQGVVVITANYRLGFQGFLVGSGVTGNQGLKDQILALKWIRDNVDSFGGDPGQVTIFGESAGGISIGALMVSPEARGLFRRSILQSGAAFSFVRPDSRSVAESKSVRFSKTLNCSREGDLIVTSEAIKCLRTLDRSAIAEFGSTEKMHSIVMPNPIYGDSVLPDNFARLIKNEETLINAEDVLIGTVNDEGAVFAMQLLHSAFDFYKPMELKIEDAKVFLRTFFVKTLDEHSVQQAINYYISSLMSTPSSKDIRELIFRAYGDLYINCPTYFTASSVAKKLGTKGRVFAYNLEYKATVDQTPECFGICHGEVLPFEFGHPFARTSRYSDVDRTMSERIMRIWTSFGKPGAPEPGWTQFSDSSDKYAILKPSSNNEGLTMDNEHYKHCKNFWEPIFQKKMNY